MREGEDDTSLPSRINMSECPSPELYMDTQRHETLEKIHPAFPFLLFLAVFLVLQKLVGASEGRRICKSKN